MRQSSRSSREIGILRDSNRPHQRITFNSFFPCISFRFVSSSSLPSHLPRFLRRRHTLSSSAFTSEPQVFLPSDHYGSIFEYLPVNSERVALVSAIHPRRSLTISTLHYPRYSSFTQPSSRFLLSALPKWIRIILPITVRPLALVRVKHPRHLMAHQYFLPAPTLSQR